MLLVFYDSHKPSGESFLIPLTAPQNLIAKLFGQQPLAAWPLCYPDVPTSPFLALQDFLQTGPDPLFCSQGLMVKNRHKQPGDDD